MHIFRTDPIDCLRPCLDRLRSFLDNIMKFEAQHGEIKDVDPTGGIPMNFGGPTAEA